VTVWKTSFLFIHVKARVRHNRIMTVMTAVIPQGMSANQAMQARADYQRAMAACLDGRGYTVK
jgi:hypothetical protein